jgi:hypothetical protein
MVTTAKVKALVAGVLDLVEHHVPAGRQEAALADLAALATQIDAGAAAALLSPASTSPPTPSRRAS